MLCGSNLKLFRVVSLSMILYLGYKKKYKISRVLKNLLILVRLASLHLYISLYGGREYDPVKDRNKMDT